MADTDRVPWSPFAPPAPEPEHGDLREQPQVDTSEGATAPPNWSEEPASPVESDSKPEPLKDPEPTLEPVTESSSALFTLHSENTSGKVDPQVTDADSAGETLHSPLNSPPIVDHAESPSGGGEPADRPTDSASDPGPDDEVLTLKSASRQWLVDVGERVQRAAAGLRPPAVWTEPPASLRDLVAYADTAPWADKSGPIRAAGRAWCRGIAVPISTVLYYVAWLAQRPSRLITLIVVYALIAHTSFGSWLPWLWPTS